MTQSSSERPAWLPDEVEVPEPSRPRTAPQPLFTPPPPPPSPPRPVAPQPAPPPPPAAVAVAPPPPAPPPVDVYAPLPKPVPPAAAAEARPAATPWRQPPPKARFWESTFFPMAALALLGALVMGVVGVQHLQQPDTSNPVFAAAKLKLAYHPAQVHRFQVAQQLSALLVLPDGEQGRAYSSLQAVEDFRVISVAADGRSATVGLKFESLSGEFDGMPITFNAAKSKEIVLVVTSDGKIVSGGTGATIGGKATTQDPGGDLFSSLLPDHDVHIGDTWSTSFRRPNPMGSGNMTYSTDNTLVRMDSIGGQQAAVIQSDYSLPIDMLLNLRQLNDWLGDDSDPVPPAGAAVKYAGSSTGSITSYFGMDTRQLLHAVETSDFQFDLTFSGLPNTAAYKDLAGKFHFGGHLQTDLQSLDAPPSSTT